MSDLQRLLQELHTAVVRMRDLQKVTQAYVSKNDLWPLFTAERDVDNLLEQIAFDSDTFLPTAPLAGVEGAIDASPKLPPI